MIYREVKEGNCTRSHVMMYFFFFGALFGLFTIVDAGIRCSTNILPVGCYKDKYGDRAMGEELLNERDKSSNVYGNRLINWMDRDYFPGFVCRCAQKAEERGFTYFGIQFYGECWSGKNSHLTYAKHGKSTNCDEKPTFTSCALGIGKQLTNYVYKIPNYNKVCQLQISPVGCFKDNHNRLRPLPSYTMNERDKTIKNWNGHLTQWNTWNQYLPQLICRCANTAKEKGHDIFAIQFYGECWSGRESETAYDIDGSSDKCIGKDYKSCSKTSSKCFDNFCVGKHYENFVYRISHVKRQADQMNDLSYDRFRQYGAKRHDGYVFRNKRWRITRYPNYEDEDEGYFLSKQKKNTELDPRYEDEDEGYSFRANRMTENQPDSSYEDDDDKYFLSKQKKDIELDPRYEDEYERYFFKANRMTEKQLDPSYEEEDYFFKYID